MDTDQFEPGANHALGGEILTSGPEDVYIELQERDPDSAWAKELERRFDFISDIWNDKQWVLQPPF